LVSFFFISIDLAIFRCVYYLLLFFLIFHPHYDTPWLFFLFCFLILVFCCCCCFQPGRNRTSTLPAKTTPPHHRRATANLIRMIQRWDLIVILDVVVTIGGFLNREKELLYVCAHPTHTGVRRSRACVYIQKCCPVCVVWSSSSGWRVWVGRWGGEKKFLFSSFSPPTFFLFFWHRSF
jgi:hypothetical protein